jgi:hypothetical protein
LWKRRAVGAYGHTATTACRNYNTDECRRYLASRKKSLQGNETCAKIKEKLLHIRCSVEAEPGKYWRESMADSLDRRQNLEKEK